MNNYCQLNAQNCPKLSPGYSMVTCAHLGGQVNWLFLLGNTCSSHCDVTVRYVTLNSNCTFDKNRQQNIHNFFVGNRSKLIKMLWWRYFENTNYWQWLNCLILNTPVFYLIFVIIILIPVFSEAFSQLSLKLYNGTFQIINHLWNSAIPLKITLYNIGKKASIKSSYSYCLFVMFSLWF